MPRLQVVALSLPLSLAALVEAGVTADDARKRSAGPRVTHVWPRSFPFAAATALAAQEGAGAQAFVPLFDGTLNGWTIESSAAGSFSVRDGVLRVEGPSGWLRSAGQYRDFVER